jgi:hypothetical protein
MQNQKKIVHTAQCCCSAFYPLFIILLCSLLFIRTPAYSQAPQICGGDLSGPLLSGDNYMVFGTGYRQPSAGVRPSSVNRIKTINDLPGVEHIWIPITSHTHELVAQQYEASSQMVYGAASRYSGGVATESSVFSAFWYQDYIGDGSGPKYLKTCTISTHGVYSVEAVHGNYLYGLRSGGGNFGFGVYFRMKKDGTGYTELYHFKGAYEKPDKLFLQYVYNGDGSPDTRYPVEFWGISFAGGSHGKGAVIKLELDGSAISTILDFTGQGGPKDGWNDTDGEGPIAIVRDVDSDVYVITQAGGLYNYGAIFMIGQDGIHRLKDFPAATGRPYGTPVVDKATMMLFGVCGSSNISEDGYLYSMYLGSGHAFNTNFVDFSSSPDVRSPISVVIGQDGRIYGNARRGTGSDQNTGLFAINQDGSNLELLEESIGCSIHVAEPADNSTNVSIAPTMVDSGTDESIFYQLSETTDFSGDVLQFHQESYDHSVEAPALKYGTTYYARARTFSDFFGPVTKFTTIAEPTGSYVISPANNTQEVSPTTLVKVLTVPGAGSYTVDLSYNPSFNFGYVSATSTSTDIQVPLLQSASTYYSRVKTNLNTEYGPIRQFTTHYAEKHAFVTNPANGSSHSHNTVPDIILNVVPGATTYTVELNTRPDFTGKSMVQSSQHSGDREFKFEGFVPGTTYYTRVTTDLSWSYWWGPTRSFTILPYSGPTIVVDPAGSSTNVSVRPIISALKVSNATNYTFQLSKTADFSGAGIDYVSTKNSTPENAVALEYATQYYARVKTNLYDYSFPISFTTRSAIQDTYVISPENGAMWLPIHDVEILCNTVWGAALYTVELNTSSDFTGTSFVQISSTPSIVFPELPLNATLHVRVKTDLSPQWSQATSFTTVFSWAAFPVSPEVGSTNVAQSPQIEFMPGISVRSYEMQLSPTADFTGQVLHFITDKPDRQPSNFQLGYSTTWYVRTKNDLWPDWTTWGSFTTQKEVDDAFVVIPADESINVPTNNLSVTSNRVLNSTTYTIEISTRPDFLEAISQTSTTNYQRSLTFNGLQTGRIYYARVKTEGTANEWGKVTSFTTTLPSSVVTSPAHNKNDVAPKTSVSVRSFPGASSYELNISTSNDFSTGVAVYNSSSTTFAINPLKYSTTYYTRVKTNISDYGTITQFTTHHPEKFSFVSSPVNGATNVAYNTLKVTANEVLGATSYTIELNTSPDFTGPWIAATSATANQRTLTFNGLEPSTTYYSRTRTNLPSGWGPVRSFTTTAATLPPPMETETEFGTWVKAYPNPFDRTFTTEVFAPGDAFISVTLFDLTGRELYRKEANTSFSEEIGEGLPQGMYLLKVMQGNTVVVRRMIKK